jgi:MoxR-like ATPase
MQAEVAAVDIPSSVKDYIVRVVQATREAKDVILYGASPR